MSAKASRMSYARQFGTLIGFLLLSAFFSILSPYFLTSSNLLIVLQQTSINAIIAVGMTFVIVTAGIDLSVGSMVAVSGVVLGSALHAGLPLPVAILAGLAVGAFCGTVNGMVVVWGGLPPFIATLGMMSIARGAALVYTGGRSISGFDSSFRFLATGEVAQIPVPVLITIGIYLIAAFVLNKTRHGLYVYAIGGNEDAARLSGVNVRFHKASVYVLSGLMSGVAALILTAKLDAAQPIAGIMYELDAIAATVIGGTSLMGGEGRLSGTFEGALIMGVLRNGLNLLLVPSYHQQVIIGAVIIGAVLVDTKMKRSRT
jgi:ribose/xylose/arabinose/galactoside ABC-type transport system permease subunit